MKPAGATYYGVRRPFFNPPDLSSGNHVLHHIPENIFSDSNIPGSAALLPMI